MLRFSLTHPMDVLTIPTAYKQLKKEKENVFSFCEKRRK